MAGQALSKAGDMALNDERVAKKIGAATRSAMDKVNERWLKKQSDTDEKGDPRSHKVKQLDITTDGPQLVATTNEALDEGERFVAESKKAYAAAKPAVEKLGKAVEHVKKNNPLTKDGWDKNKDGTVTFDEVLQGVEGHLANASSALSALASIANAIDKVMKSLADALDRMAMTQLAKPKSPRLWLTAADNVEVGSNKKFHVYAVDGMELESPKGGMRVHTEKGIALRASEEGEFIAVKHLWLEGTTGAELSSKGPAVLASRQDHAEILGKVVRVGALNTPQSARKDEEKPLGGGFVADKQHNTTTLHAMATDALVLQVGGAMPQKDKAQLEPSTPAYLSADKQGQVKVHTLNDGKIRLQVFKFAIDITKDDIKLGLTSSIDGAPDKALVVIDGEGRIALENKANRVGLDTSDGAWVLPGSSTKLEMKKAGVKIKGNKIDLG